MYLQCFPYHESVVERRRVENAAWAELMSHQVVFQDSSYYEVLIHCQWGIGLSAICISIWLCRVFLQQKLKMFMDGTKGKVENHPNEPNSKRSGLGCSKKAPPLQISNFSSSH